MLIEKRFKLTIQALEKGHRYLEPLSEKEVHEISQNLALESSLLLESLCLLQNTSSYVFSLAPKLIKLLEKSDQAELIIHLLNASRRHIISASQRSGQRLTPEYLMSLKKHLHSSSPEVVEWSLRTIDECGAQALVFKEDLKKIYPNKLSMLFNEHKRHIRGIIDLIFKKWNSSHEL